MAASWSGGLEKSAHTVRGNAGGGGDTCKKQPRTAIFSIMRCRFTSAAFRYGYRRPTFAMARAAASNSVRSRLARKRLWRVRQPWNGAKRAAKN